MSTAPTRSARDKKPKGSPPVARVVFPDLAPHVEPEDSLTAHDDAWLTDLVQQVTVSDYAIPLAASMAATEPEPVLQRQLDGSWRAGRYIGELRSGGRTLEIRPRLGIDTIAAWASAALNLKVIPRTADHRSTTATLIVELTAAIWRRALIDAARNGRPGIRQDRRHEGMAGRGRLDIAATLNLRAARIPYLATVERTKNVNNPISQSIVLADRVLDARLGHRPGWRGERVTEIIQHLRAATGPRPQLPPRHELDHVRYSPITAPYRRVAALSWEIARRRGVRAQATDDTVEGLLIDVAELWELFVVHCVRRAVNPALVTHGTYLHHARGLLRSTRDPEVTLGRLYPDILIGDLDTPAAIIDAKYKPLTDRRRGDREDLYQLTSYLTAHSQDPSAPALGALAYPQFDDREPTFSERLGPWRTPQGHQVDFRRLPTTEEACTRTLATKLAKALTR